LTGEIVVELGSIRQDLIAIFFLGSRYGQSSSRSISTEFTWRFPSEGPSRAAAKTQDSAGEGAPQQSGMPQGGGGVASHAESEDEELELGTSTPYVQYAGGSHRGTIGDC